MIILFFFCGYFVAGGKRKHDEKRDDQVSKHIHLDPESTDGFADLTTLVNMSSAVPLSVSQVAFFKKGKKDLDYELICGNIPHVVS